MIKIYSSTNFLEADKILAVLEQNKIPAKKMAGTFMDVLSGRLMETSDIYVAEVYEEQAHALVDELQHHKVQNSNTKLRILAVIGLVMIVAVMCVVFLGGCGQTEVKITEKKPANAEAYSLTNYSCPVNFDNASYMDSLEVDGKFEVFSLIYQNGDKPTPYLVCDIFDDATGKWSQEKNPLTGEALKYFDASDRKNQKYGFINKICKGKDGSLYGLYKEYQLKKESGDYYSQKYTQYGVFEINPHTGEMQNLWMKEFDAEESLQGTEDFDQLEDGSFAIYFPWKKMIKLYDVIGTQLETVDLTGKVSGTVQLYQGDIWALNSDTGKLLQLEYHDKGVSKKNEITFTSEEQESWRIFGDESDGYMIQYASTLYRISKDNKPKEISADIQGSSQLPQSQAATEIVSADEGGKTYLLDIVRDEKDDQKDEMRLFVLEEKQ